MKPNNNTQDITDLYEGFVSAKDNTDFSKVLAELFDKNKINLISDLTSDEIKLITRIKMIAYLKKIPSWDKTIQTYLELKISHKRQSRKEITEIFKEQFRRSVFGFRRGGGMNEN